MEDKLNKYFIALRNFSRLFTQRVIENGTSMGIDLKLSQIKAISAFRHESCLSMKELAENIGVKLSNMTMMIDNLIKEGLAKRDRDEIDRRKVMVRLTPYGEKIRSEFLIHRRKIAESTFSTLTEEEKDQLLLSLETACRLLEKSLSADTTKS